MARGITEEEVHQAADAIVARGERPTIERIRAELGRGSPNTVNRHLDAWWAQLSKRLAPQADDLPGEIVDLARWAAWRWAGRPASLLGTASPPRAVPRDWRCNRRCGGCA